MATEVERLLKGSGWLLEILRRSDAVILSLWTAMLLQKGRGL
jgi:hypothetical protein